MRLTAAGQGVQSTLPGGGDLLSLPDRGEYIRGRFRVLSRRMQDVRVVHGDWTRCLNSHYGGKGDRVGVFMDPPYLSYEHLYAEQRPVAIAAAEWAAAHPEMRIVICGHAGDYDAVLPGWRQVPWSRGKFTYNGRATTDKEAIYLSPACSSVDVSSLKVADGE